MAKVACSGAGEVLSNGESDEREEQPKPAKATNAKASVPTLTAWAYDSAYVRICSRTVSSLMPVRR